VSKIRDALNAPIESDRKCAYCEWLFALDAEDRAAVIEFYGSTLTTTEIIRRLQPFGMPVSHHPFTQHRKGRHKDWL
jgi:hypothetical protein